VASGQWLVAGSACGRVGERCPRAQYDSPRCETGVLARFQKSGVRISDLLRRMPIAEARRQKSEVSVSVSVSKLKTEAPHGSERHRTLNLELRIPKPGERCELRNTMGSMTRPWVQ